MTQDRIVREPRQRRTREAWERVLTVGAELFITGGLEALTVGEVCRRSGISAPSLYARVNGRAGLVAAVYEHLMIEVAVSDAEIFGALPAPDAPLGTRIAGVVTAASTQFSRNARVLRPMIAASMHDEWIHRRGLAEAQRVIATLAEALALEETAARDIATTLFSELLVRTMYGADFSSPFAPGEDAVHDRLMRMATARADSSGAGR